MEGSFAFGKANKSLYNFFTNLIFLYRLINKVVLVSNSEVEKWMFSNYYAFGNFALLKQ
jgi:hypothetical protein